MACALAATPTSTTAQEEKRASIWERIFGTSEKPSKGTAQHEADNSEKEDADKTKAKKKKAEKPLKKDTKEKDASFNEEEREVLESWQKGNAKWKKSKKPLPPCLKKKVARGGEFPPGWKKKLEVGTVLGEEVYEQRESLPEDILKRLPKTPDGTEIIRIFENSREIIDIHSGSRTRTASQY